MWHHYVIPMVEAVNNIRMFYSKGVLSKRIILSWEFCPRRFCPGVFVIRGFVLEGVCPTPVKSYHTRLQSATPLQSNQPRTISWILTFPTLVLRRFLATRSSP